MRCVPAKTPVLLVGNEAIFESAVICEYLEETALPRLQPADALQRWRRALALRKSVAESVRPEYPELLRSFLLARRTALSRRMTDRRPARHKASADVDAVEGNG